MSEITTKKCQAYNIEGQPCRAWAMKNEIYCFQHNPDISKEEKLELAGKGGRNKKKTNVYPKIEINTVEDLKKFINDTLLLMKQGKLNENTARTMFYGVSIFVKVFEATDLNKELKEVKDLLQNYKQVI